MKKYFALLLLVGPVTLACAQALSPGESFYKQGNYALAVPLLLAESKVNPQNARLLYDIGVSYLRSRSQKHKAADYLQKAVALSPSIGTRRESGPMEAVQDAWFYYAESLEHLARFDDAQVWY